jgi:hypothetical protein
VPLRHVAFRREAPAAAVPAAATVSAVLENDDEISGSAMLMICSRIEG